MKIALDISPLSSGHKIRGVGTYTANLVEALKQYDRRNSYIFFTRTELVPKDADLVHYPYFDPFFLTLPLLKPAKTVVTIHDLIPLVFPEWFPSGIRGRIKWEIQKLSLRGVKAIITDSKCSKKDIIHFTGFPKDKIHVIYPAPGPEYRRLNNTLLMHRIRVKYNLPEKFILYVGDVNYSKNILGLIKAFRFYTSEVSPRVKRGGPSTSEVKLVLVGKAFLDESLRETHQLLQLIKSLGLNEKVLRLGWVPKEDLPAIYNLAAVYCQPSFYEGFGLPVLEAMSCGCPVVAAKGGSLPEIAGEAAFYVDVDNTDNIAEGIQEVFSSEETQKKLSQKGLAQAKKFSWEKTAEETIGVYERTH